MAKLIIEYAFAKSSDTEENYKVKNVVSTKGQYWRVERHRWPDFIETLRNGMGLDAALAKFRPQVASLDGSPGFDGQVMKQLSVRHCIQEIEV